MRLDAVPKVRVDDLQIHPRTNDLVIATHGRSLDILDDTRALRELTPEIMAKPTHLFSVGTDERILSAARFRGVITAKAFIAGKIRLKARSSRFGQEISPAMRSRSRSRMRPASRWQT